MNKHLLSIFLMVLAPFAVAQDSALYGLKQVKIIPGWRLENGNHMMAVDITLEKNWKTYWRVAGSGGVPPRFDWQGSDNILAARLHWPSPNLFMEDDVKTVGYKDRLILPVEITPKTKNTAINVQLKLDIGICNELCMPIQVNLSAKLSKRLSFGKAQIKAALDDKVKYSNQKFHCEFEPFEHGMLIHTQLPYAGNADAATVFIEYPSDEWINQGRSKRVAQTLHTTAQYYKDTSAVLDRRSFTATVISTKGAIQYNGCTSSAG